MVYLRGYRIQGYYIYKDMSDTAINRRQEGLVIPNIDGAIKRINEMKYVVESQNANGVSLLCIDKLYCRLRDIKERR